MIIDGNSIMERNIELMKKDILGVMLVMIMVCCTILSGCGKKATENTVKTDQPKMKLETEYNNTTETESADTENTNTENTNIENTNTEKIQNTEKYKYRLRESYRYDMEEYADGYIIVSKQIIYYMELLILMEEKLFLWNMIILILLEEMVRVDIDQGIYFFCASMKGKNKYLTVAEKSVLDGDIEMQSPYLGSVDENSPFFYEKYDDPSDDYLEHDLSLRFYNVKGIYLCDIDVLDLDSINNSEYYNGSIGIKDVELITDDRILVGLCGGSETA